MKRNDSNKGLSTFQQFVSVVKICSQLNLSFRSGPFHESAFQQQIHPYHLRRKKMQNQEEIHQNTNHEIFFYQKNAIVLSPFLQIRELH